MRHKHIYTEEVKKTKDSRMTTITSEVSKCPIQDWDKCMAYEFRKRKRML